jgi:SAM-dependent methyltransferase
VARQAPARAWIGLALAAASKGLPILLAPLLFRHQVPALGIRRTLGAAAPGAVLGALLLAPYLPELVTAVGASADLYVRLFEFNGGPYLLLKEGLVLLTGEDWGRLLGPALRWVFLGGALLVWIRSPVAGRDWFRASVLVFALYLATATTVHPWYLLWGLAYVPFTPLLRGTWLWASWAAYLTYFTYVDVPHGALAAVFWIGAAAFSLRDIEGPARDRLLRIAGRRKARQIVRHIEGRRILDLGAAEGYVADRLRAPGRSLLLMDVGPFFRVPLPGVVYDGRRIPLGDRSVDTVLISLALHHARAPAEVVSEALRVARRRVVVTESTYRWGLERRLLRIADRVANRGRGFERDPAGAGPPHFRTLGEWSDLFGRSGARVLSVERLNRIGHRHVAFVLVPSRTGQTSAPHEPHSPSR